MGLTMCTAATCCSGGCGGCCPTDTGTSLEKVEDIDSSSGEEGANRTISAVLRDEWNRDHVHDEPKTMTYSEQKDLIQAARTASPQAGYKRSTSVFQPDPEETGRDFAANADVNMEFLEVERLRNISEYYNSIDAKTRQQIVEHYNRIDAQQDLTPEAPPKAPSSSIKPEENVKPEGSSSTEASTQRQKLRREIRKFKDEILLPFVKEPKDDNKLHPEHADVNDVKLLEKRSNLAEIMEEKINRMPNWAEWSSILEPGSEALTHEQNRTMAQEKILYQGLKFLRVDLQIHQLQIDVSHELSHRANDVTKAMSKCDSEEGAKPIREINGVLNTYRYEVLPYEKKDREALFSSLESKILQLLASTTSPGVQNHDDVLESLKSEFEKIHQSLHEMFSAVRAKKVEGNKDLWSKLAKMSTELVKETTTQCAEFIQDVYQEDVPDRKDFR